MVELKLLSRLLDYPTETLFESLPEVIDLLQQNDLPETAKAAIIRFVETRRRRPLLDWQSDYDGLFERGRAVSLHLFEHIHGESRDRGQAMINLLAQYRQAGLELHSRELPDYLPLYLEFVATQGANIQGWLQDISHVLALLQTRLEERGSDYSMLAAALISIAGIQVDYDPLREQVAKEAPDHTPEALDKIWEEEAVRFTGQDAMQGCESGQFRPQPGQRRDDVTHVNLMEASSYSSTRADSTVAAGGQS